MTLTVIRLQTKMLRTQTRRNTLHTRPMSPSLRHLWPLCPGASKRPSRAQIGFNSATKRANTTKRRKMMSLTSTQTNRTSTLRSRAYTTRTILLTSQTHKAVTIIRGNPKKGTLQLGLALPLAQPGLPTSMGHSTDRNCTRASQR